MSLKCFQLFYVIPLAFGWMHCASADNISLGVHGQLQGTIEPSASEGMIQLRSPLAADPLLVKKDTISSLKFSNPKQAAKLPQVIRLKNGDQLPIEIESFSNNVLRFISPWNTTHDLEKNRIDSLSLGTSDSKILYSGPKQKEWNLSDGCKFNDGVVQFGSSGQASWQVPKLPSRHIITCNLDFKSDGNIKIIIASDSAQPYSSEMSGYTITMNQETLQMTRNLKAGKKIYLLNEFNQHYWALLKKPTSSALPSSSSSTTTTTTTTTTTSSSSPPSSSSCAPSSPSYGDL
jgi:hypothetical protein